MRRYAQLYLLYVVGFIPFFVATYFLQGLFLVPWAANAHTMGYEIGMLAHDDIPWVFISGAMVAAIFRVLLNRLVATQPRHYLLLATGAGLVAAAATEGLLAAVGPLTHSDAWQVSAMVVDIPATCACAALLYGLVATVWVYNDSFPFDGLFRLRSRWNGAINWLYRPVIPLRGVKKLRWELHLAFFDWNPDDAFDAVPMPTRVKKIAEATEREDEEPELLDELGELDEAEEAKLLEWVELTKELHFVVKEMLRIEKTQKKRRAIDATVGREILGSLDRCEEMLADQELDAEMAKQRYRMTRFMKESRRIAEILVKISALASPMGLPRPS